jgi:hypothetical protein
MVWYCSTAPGPPITPKRSVTGGSCDGEADAELEEDDEDEVDEPGADEAAEPPESPEPHAASRAVVVAPARTRAPARHRLRPRLTTP